MDYIEVSICIQPKSPGTDIMIAMLSQIGYESFMESDEELKAYINSIDFNQSDLDNIISHLKNEYVVTYEQLLLKSRNWNEVWESNFQPVLIAGQVYVKAPFHKPDNSVNYEILIEPKMSFGTAHHETTSMMIELMLEEKLSGLSVLDMGCGTGILAILAEMLGAKNVLAVDNDEWAYENSLENVRKNKCRKISVLLGNADILDHERFEMIVANINRNVLLDDLKKYADHLVTGGVLLLSGFYVTDLDIITRAAMKFGLSINSKVEKNNWIAARFIKSLPAGKL